MQITDNPLNDFYAHENEIAEAAADRPECDECNETIWDEYYYEVRGRIYCPACMDEKRRWID